jgi:hypothetical protein
MLVPLKAIESYGDVEVQLQSFLITELWGFGNGENLFLLPVIEPRSDIRRTK